ncbi:pig-B [Schizosaccharomyces pombe]|uniref:GPI mannosyltransferase 3 n=1 Tax=Schizosaccharomyces pombe (strain 972 / ATCC 24843) TaxID=284812 RepID=GPI10_SCHPO|nr:putative pig-B family GPI synthesis protein [Schizosaccharomyces pombe]Q9USN0.1 RecName: Full=GPI mannosyltransferase 3; AltName: Full=GPI mannosyltransferase III; Short=GPI-MT-III; AltName: Full=Glycosylphosphatidylinositol-anchor biosynthesis protein 10 [Schizosaccharomyces pombe 972h-]CAB53078.1 pig-B (predicted) [Schizosaccharomyces pombe]|eukprot:NP_587993.1 putative pig-B family GPI synthesis protein [Schizosaccharomyces pombe]
MRIWFWLAILVFRWWNALWVKTFFQPDEFYQSLEVAHHFIFRYGFLTWEWTSAIRSALHPLIFAALYRVLQVLKLDSSYFVFTNAPKLLQGTFAAILDYGTYKFALVRYGSKTANWTLACSLVSIMNAYVGVRTFSNSLETTLTSIGFYYFSYYLKYENSSPEQRKKAYSSLLGFISVAAFACFIRPTNILVWIFPLLFWNKNPQTPIKDLLSFSNVFNRFRFLYALGYGRLFGIFVLCVSLFLVNIIADRILYGRFVFPIISFFQFNVTSGLSSLYGLNAWHYYLSQALPLICGGFLPFVLLTMDLQTAGTILCVFFPYSLIGHKELRFVYPISPILLTLAGKFFSSFSSWKRAARFFFLIGLGHALVITFLCRFHQFGVMEVMPLIHSLAEKNQTGLILAPCHTTPWQSHIHSPFAENGWKFLTCEPFEKPFDETDRFYENMPTFLDKIKEWPDYLIFFEERFYSLYSYLDSRGLKYEEVQRYYNSLIPESRERAGALLVYKKL